MTSASESEPLSAAGRATVAASVTALVLVVLKITAGIGSGATVLVASAMDSGMDFMVSLFNHLAVRNSEKPSDDKFNYGRGKVEGLASFLEGLVIAFSSVVILFTAVLKIVRREQVAHPLPALVVMIISALMTAALVYYLRRVAKKTGSLVIKADALHYVTDLYTNLGILAALVIMGRTGWWLIDPIISILIAGYILHASWSLIKEGMDMLLDRALPQEITERIEALIPTVSTHIDSFHQLKTRRSADVFFVDVHLVFHRHISLMEAHRISERVEEQIADLETGRWVINCHMDPYDDSRRDIAKAP